MRLRERLRPQEPNAIWAVLTLARLPIWGAFLGPLSPSLFSDLCEVLPPWLVVRIQKSKLSYPASGLPQAVIQGPLLGTVTGERSRGPTQL